jgi:hypothetical protein
MNMDSAAKNYPGILRVQNKYDTFDILATPSFICFKIFAKYRFKYKNCQSCISYTVSH